MLRVISCARSMRRRRSRVPTSLGNAHRLKDDVHAQRVVDEPFARVDLGVDARPELDRGLELRGPREQLVLSAGVKGEKDEGVGYRQRAICDAHVVASDSCSRCSFLDYVHRARRPSGRSSRPKTAERRASLTGFSCLFLSACGRKLPHCLRAVKVFAGSALASRAARGRGPRESPAGAVPTSRECRPTRCRPSEAARRRRRRRLVAARRIASETIEPRRRAASRGSPTAKRQPVSRAPIYPQRERAVRSSGICRSDSARDTRLVVLAVLEPGIDARVAPRARPDTRAPFER